MLAIGRFVVLTLSAITLSSPSHAAVSVDRHMMSAAEGDGLRAPAVGWSLSDDGTVVLTKNLCPGCRGLQQLIYQFKIDAAMLARLDAVLPDDLIESATRAPCTLQHAETGWAQRVSISSTKGGGESHRSFFHQCRSPELTILRERIDQFARMLMKEAEEQNIVPERRN